MTVKQIQCLLCYLGYDPGGVDGVWGEKTQGAANRFRAAAGLPAEYLRVIFRAVGICLLTQLAADTCRDAGEQSLAAKAELAGKCFMLLLALPLFERLLSLVTGLIRGEGMT